MQPCNFKIMIYFTLTKLIFTSCFFRLLAYSMEEDNDDVLITELEISEDLDLIKIKLIRDWLFRKMEFRAAVSKTCCQIIMKAAQPDHKIWKRRRHPNHSGAHGDKDRLVLFICFFFNLINLKNKTTIPVLKEFEKIDCFFNCVYRYRHDCIILQSHTDKRWSRLFFAHFYKNYGRLFLQIFSKIIMLNSKVLEIRWFWVVQGNGQEWERGGGNLETYFGYKYWGIYLKKSKNLSSLIGEYAYLQ